MQAWNTVVTIQPEGMADACRVLGRFGHVQRTGYYNVLTLLASHPDGLARDYAALLAGSPGVANFISHLVPAQHAFDFATVEDFEAKARKVVLGWAPRLAGRIFHVRLHRRGLKGVLSTPLEERRLDELLIKALQESGTPGRIGFEAPDHIIQVETVDDRAGLSLWSKEELEHYPFLGVD